MFGAQLVRLYIPATTNTMMPASHCQGRVKEGQDAWA